MKGDVAYESNETLSLTLSNPTGAKVGDGVAQGTITNDDKAPTSLTLRVVRKPRAVWRVACGVCMWRRASWSRRSPASASS